MRENAGGAKLKERGFTELPLIAREPETEGNFWEKAAGLEGATGSRTKPDPVEENTRTKPRSKGLRKTRSWQ